MRIATFQHQGRRQVGLVGPDGSSVTPLAFTAEEARRAEALAAGLETRLDRPVRVRPKGDGAVVEITLSDLADLGRLADDLG